MNTTVNGSRCSNLFNPTAEKIGTTIALCLIIVVSLVGNSFIALIVYKTQNMRKSINYFITNMAMSDLLFPIITFPLRLTKMYGLNSRFISGPLGQALCKMGPSLGDVSAVVSIQSLVLIAVDRFGAVVFPLRSPFISSKLCLFFIFATWIVAMAVNLPQFVAFKLVEHHGQLACVRRWNEAFGESSSEATFFLAQHVVFLYIPITLLAILYSIILVKLQSQKIPGEQSVNAEEQRTRRNRHVLKMAIAIVVVFALCWLPFSIINLVLFYIVWDSRSPFCGMRILSTISWFMAVSNCAVNPCICFIFSGNYREGLKRLLKCFG